MDRRDALRLLSVPAFAPALGVFDFGPARASAVAQTPSRPPDVELTLVAAAAEVALLPGDPTRVWRYTATVVRGPASTVQTLPGSYLGPVLRFRRGQQVRVRFENRLTEPSIVHWHGLDVPESADGHPRLAIAGGREYVYDFEVINRAGTYWYHPHPHMRTGAQAYHGLSGVIIVSDPEDDGLELPAGDAELVLVLQDRRFDANNQLVYAAGADTGRGGGMGRMGRGGGRGMGGGMGQMMETMNGWLGDRLFVSGTHQPRRTIERRPYRVRLLNGSNARIYNLAWSDGRPFTVLGGDGGLLEHVRTQPRLTLAPGQRADVLLDCSTQRAGSTFSLRSLAYPAAAVGHVGMMGETSPLPQGAATELMTFAVAGGAGHPMTLPERLSARPDAWLAPSDAPVRTVPLTFMRMEWLIDGRTYDIDEVAANETVAPGSTHVWEFRNQLNPMGMAMAHPIHVHGRQFRVLSRSGAGGNALTAGINDAGPTDTVLVLPGETVRVQLTFSRYPGLFLYHCHILEHEDMGMMRNFRITAPARG
ncbi:MAG: multicopper oxidase domain-containing protein [Acidobacteria bacterium]|nr:multicopper oxidase domain-containing protein [Acidobacteriota bacterium]